MREYTDQTELKYISHTDKIVLINLIYRNGNLTFEVRFKFVYLEGAVEDSTYLCVTLRNSKTF